ncbi:MAG: macrolide ABC transporter ATP-binding protein, partial [Candidatus Infernicultor aquiphilus]
MLEIKKITKVYKMGEVLVNALRGVSFHINKGQFVAIMGPSGSGKSTLMHIIGCLDHPTEGIFIMDGEDISKVNDNKLAEIRNKKIGFVFQQFNLLARTTILYNVEVPLIYAGVNSKKRKKLAEQAL